MSSTATGRTTGKRSPVESPAVRSAGRRPGFRRQPDQASVVVADPARRPDGGDHRYPAGAGGDHLTARPRPVLAAVVDRRAVHRFRQLCRVDHRGRCPALGLDQCLHRGADHPDHPAAGHRRRARRPQHDARARSDPLDLPAALRHSGIRHRDGLADDAVTGRCGEQRTRPVRRHRSGLAERDHQLLDDDPGQQLVGLAVHLSVVAGRPAGAQYRGDGGGLAGRGRLGEEALVRRAATDPWTDRAGRGDRHPGAPEQLHPAVHPVRQPGAGSDPGAADVDLHHVLPVGAFRARLGDGVDLGGVGRHPAGRLSADHQAGDQTKARWVDE